MPMSSVLVDRAGAAPERMGGGGEDRLVEQIFPIAGELLLADDHGADGLHARARRDDHRIAEFCLARAAKLERRAVQPVERLHEAEPAHRIDGERVSGGDAAAGVGKPDILGLHDEIADRQHETAFPDDDAAARPLLAQRLGGESVLRNGGLDGHDRFERSVQIGAEVARSRQAGLWFVASRLLGHRPFPSAAWLKWEHSA